MRAVCEFPESGRTVFRCPECGHRTLAPFPAAEELERFYGRERYFSDDLSSLHDDLRDGYDPETPILKLYRRHLDALRKAAPPPARLLEVGCARGVFLDLASKAGYAAVGIDRNPHGADHAREHFGVDAAAGEFERSALADGSFGAVASYDTIEHVADPRAFMRTVAAALAPGGAAAIGTPDAGSPLLRAAETAATATGGAWRYPLWRVYGNGVEHLHLFTRSGLARLARECGLEPFSAYGYSIPVRNMRDLTPLYGAALRLASAVPYEFVMMARKPSHP
ncbi:MAG TPA: class I SAM-dependent methyltransferase [Candidatus Eisenbacteria bacterium]|jgi:2-polyprenyl-3-methyl-5-hydroxy-6-metoxy-1,4-benzoquinol methylase|nr:class I SAM-dependent methyltransferase [Candidatus Eisenbacteria bacterium]